MNALYSLYDALISINVPADRARKVVDAMEREMAAILATKDDVALLRQEMRGEFALARQEMQGGLGQLRQETQGEFAQLRQEVQGGLGQLRQETQGEFAQLRQEMRGSLGQLQQETQGEFARLRQEVNSQFALLAKDIRMLDDKIEHKVALLRSSMMVWLGSIQVVGLGLLFAALKLT